MSTDRELLISLKDVSLTYKLKKDWLSRQKITIEALKNVNLDIYKGEKIGIIGPNGSGKSTLTKIIGGILEPNTGTVTYHKKVTVQLLTLGVGIESTLSGRDNAILSGMLLGRTREYMRNRLEKIKEFSGLGKFFEYPVSSYSSGMVSRLTFSVAIEADPDVLILDEILSVGDADFAAKSREAIEKYFESGRTVLLISHDLDAINQVCDRIITFRDGGLFDRMKTEMFST